jgi:hypothetical protein
MSGHPETFHKIRLGMQVKKEQPGAAYTPLHLKD